MSTLGADEDEAGWIESRANRINGELAAGREGELARRAARVSDR